jgi:hypothetical protein
MALISMYQEEVDSGLYELAYKEAVSDLNASNTAVNDIPAQCNTAVEMKVRVSKKNIADQS